MVQSPHLIYYLIITPKVWICYDRLLSDNLEFTFYFEYLRIAYSSESPQQPYSVGLKTVVGILL